MKKYLFILLTVGTSCWSNVLPAQIFSVGAAGVTLKANTVLNADGLILTPSADITLAATSLTRNATVVHTPSQPYISRVYRFSATTAPFSGTSQINYIDPGELNGIPEANLQMNIHNGTLWQAFSGTVNTAANYVLSNPVTNVLLNELTLANISAPLPLSGLSLTATKQNKGVMLQWTSVDVQDAKEFIVQFSTDGRQWNDLTTIPSGSINSSTNTYNYIHPVSVTGTYQYRILQTNYDGRKHYSELRIVKFTGDNAMFSILINPVTDGLLQVQVNSPISLALYNAEGKKLWQKNMNAGLQNIDVSRYSKGIYLLRGNDATLKFNLQ